MFKEAQLYSDKDKTKLNVHFLDQNNPKPKYKGGSVS